jgi:probable F420-dependent oxidoreductase
MLSDAYPARFLLGIGVSHRGSVARRGAVYERPLSAMRGYLDAMDRAPSTAPEPEVAPRLVLAALGPRMLELAAARADGAHPYFVPVGHTPIARAALGPEPCLAVEQTAVLSTDPAEARRIGRAFVRHYLALPNYANNLRRLGWADSDIANGGSDAIVDAVCVWGDAAAIKKRVDDHLGRGADHVAIQVIRVDINAPVSQEWKTLAPALLAAR